MFLARDEYVADTFGGNGVAVFLDSKQKTYYSDVSVQPLIPAEVLKSISGRGEPIWDLENKIRYMPLRMGVRITGSFAIHNCHLPRETLEANFEEITKSLK